MLLMLALLCEASLRLLTRDARPKRGSAHPESLSRKAFTNPLPPSGHLQAHLCKPVLRVPHAEVFSLGNHSCKLTFYDMSTKNALRDRTIISDFAPGATGAPPEADTCTSSTSSTWSPSQGFDDVGKVADLCLRALCPTRDFQVHCSQPVGDQLKVLNL